MDYHGYGCICGRHRGGGAVADSRDVEAKMTKSKAEAEVKKINKTGPEWFCPLVRGRCVSECINFSKAEAYNENGGDKLRDIKQDDFQVLGQHCHNAMFLETMICTGGDE